MALWFLLWLLSIVDLLSAFVVSFFVVIKVCFFSEMKKTNKTMLHYGINIVLSVSCLHKTYIPKNRVIKFHLTYMPHLFTTSRVSASYGLSFWDGLYYLELQVQPFFWDILQLLMHLWSLSKGIPSSTGNLIEYGFIMLWYAIEMWKICHIWDLLVFCRLNLRGTSSRTENERWLHSQFCSFTKFRCLQG